MAYTTEPFVKRKALRCPVSVVLASYNGVSFIQEQIHSIVSQLSDNDELIVSDDGSTDGTLGVINAIRNQPHRCTIRLVDGPHKGVINNFANGIQLTTNNIVLLSDQDDIWLDSKVNKVVCAFELILKPNSIAKPIAAEKFLLFPDL